MYRVLCCSYCRNRHDWWTMFTLPAAIAHCVVAKTPMWPPRRFLNRWALHPVPAGCVAFTHQLMVSNALWSKNEKTVWDINWECVFMNMGLWYAMMAGGTYFSRHILTKYSKEWRLRVWEHRRERRSCANKYLPTYVGLLTEDFDLVVMVWWVNMYHGVWMTIAMGLDKQVHATYGFFFRQFSYAQWCSPRWREQREVLIKQHYETIEKPGKFQRWGNMFTCDEWRDSPQ